MVQNDVEVVARVGELLQPRHWHPAHRRVLRRYLVVPVERTGIVSEDHVERHELGLQPPPPERGMTAAADKGPAGQALGCLLQRPALGPKWSGVVADPEPELCRRQSLDSSTRPVAAVLYDVDGAVGLDAGLDNVSLGNDRCWRRARTDRRARAKPWARYDGHRTRDQLSQELERSDAAGGTALLGKNEQGVARAPLDAMLREQFQAEAPHRGFRSGGPAGGLAPCDRVDGQLAHLLLKPEVPDAGSSFGGG